VTDQSRVLDDGTVLHDPGNHLLRIDALWAFISVDDDGNEGLCGYPLDGMTMPMIAADGDRVASLVGLAERLALMTGKKIKLIKLSAREEFTTFGSNSSDPAQD
jgi:hypothetical protein